ncbi:hypothetical protein MRX96_021878 [Rhipicephalus microplus]
MSIVHDVPVRYTPGSVLAAAVGLRCMVARPDRCRRTFAPIIRVGCAPIQSDSLQYDDIRRSQLTVDRRWPRTVSRTAKKLRFDERVDRTLRGDSRYPKMVTALPKSPDLTNVLAERAV